MLEAVRISLQTNEAINSEVTIKVRTIEGKFISRNFRKHNLIKDIYDWVFVEMGTGFNKAFELSMFGDNTIMYSEKTILESINLVSFKIGDMMRCKCSCS